MYTMSMSDPPTVPEVLFTQHNQQLNFMNRINILSEY